MNPEEILSRDYGSLAEARKHVEEKRFNPEGVKCPCCSQKAKAWKKALISTAVADLIRLVKLAGSGPMHIDDFTLTPKDRNFSQLKLWGLVKTVSDVKGKRSSGVWQATTRGQLFAQNMVQVQSHVVTYNNELIKFDGPNVYAKDVLGTKFNFEKLWDDQYDLDV